MSESLASALVWCLLLTAVLEIITCLLRFLFRLEATRDTSFLGILTFGLRIHHCYVGLAVATAGVILGADGLSWWLIVGTAFVLSDLVHHFVVLRLVTGEPEFDLFYP